MTTFTPGAKIHMIGIAGSGMSGIAEILAARGFIVSGSDEKESATLRSLASQGIRTYVGHKGEQIGDARYVVISSAIREENPELVAAKERGIEIVRRASALARLLPGKFSIAVAGTHGKTTTSGMFSQMLDVLGRDPSFVIGSKISALGVSAREGRGDFFVVEADESDGSFLDYKPDGAIITNVELDHVDNFSSIEEIVRLFERFIATTKDFVVICGDDLRASALPVPSGIRRVTYGTSATCDLVISEIKELSDGVSATLQWQGGSIVQLRLFVHGRHNVLNAAAVVASAVAMGIDLADAASAISAFRGTSRRFEAKGVFDGITVVDDYGHHPTEIEATISAARAVLAAAGIGRLCVIFQPHRFSRTAAFAASFARALAGADRSVVMDIYSAGEVPLPGVSSATIAEESRDSIYLSDRERVIDEVVQWAEPGDLVLTLGAGDVTEIGPKILAALKSRS